MKKKPGTIKTFLTIVLLVALSSLLTSFRGSHEPHSASHGTCEELKLAPGLFIKECKYQNGVQSYRAMVQDGKVSGTEEFYYESGQVKILQYSFNGALQGDYFEWYPNGILKVTGKYFVFPKHTSEFRSTRYLDDEETGDKIVITHAEFPGSLKDGTWRYYNEEGRMLRDEFWSQDSLISTIERR